MPVIVMKWVRCIDTIASIDVRCDKPGMMFTWMIVLVFDARDTPSGWYT
jgi:hypothetical protein